MQTIEKKRYFITGKPSIYPGEELAVFTDTYAVVGGEEKPLVVHGTRHLFMPREISEREAEAWKGRSKDSKLLPETRATKEAEAERIAAVNARAFELEEIGRGMLEESLKNPEVKRTLDKVQQRLANGLLSLRGEKTLEGKEKILASIDIFLKNAGLGG